MQRSASGKTTPVRLAQLDGPAVAHVIGEWEYRPAVLYKVPVAELRASSRVRGYNTGQFALQHPGEADMALLAYDDKYLYAAFRFAANAACIARLPLRCRGVLVYVRTIGISLTQ